VQERKEILGGGDDLGLVSSMLWPLRTQEIVLVLPYAVQLLHHNLLSVPCLNPEAGILS